MPSVVANREDLLTRLQCVQAGLSNKDVVAQSSCFIFKNGEVITFNDEISCRYRSGLANEIEASVSAKPIIQLLDEIVADEIEIDLNDTRFRIIGKDEWSDISMEKRILLAYHSVEQPKKWNPIPEEFTAAVNMVRHCASKDETRFKLTCIHLSRKWIETCDNLQVARYWVETGVEEECLVRSRSLSQIISLGMTEVGETTSWLHFKNPTGLILSCRRTTDVQNYPQIPKVYNFTGEPLVLPKGLPEYMSKAGIFSAENVDNDYVRVEIKDGELRVIGKGSTGKYTGLKGVKYDGPGIKFMIDPELLSNITKKYNECEVQEDPPRLKVNGGNYIYVTSLGKIPTASTAPAEKEKEKEKK